MESERDEQFLTHEDDRRILFEWIPDAPFQSAKAVIAKRESAIGDHYHMKKDETFFLLSGVARRVVVGLREEREVFAPKKWVIPRGAYHVFELERGAVLLCAATGPFDPADEIKGKPSGMSSDDKENRIRGK